MKYVYGATLIARTAEDDAREAEVAYLLRMIRQQAAAEVFGELFDLGDLGYEFRREALIESGAEVPA